MLWGFISRYVPGAAPEAMPVLARLVEYAIRYYQDFVKPAKKYRAPTAAEREAMADLLTQLEGLPADADAEAIQTEVYEVGKRHDFENLRAWFKTLYEVLLGQESGAAHGILHRPLRRPGNHRPDRPGAGG